MNLLIGLMLSEFLGSLKFENVLRFGGKVTNEKDCFCCLRSLSWATKARDWNTERIDHLIHCLAGNTCLPKEKEIVILGSGHFGQ